MDSEPIQTSPLDLSLHTSTPSLTVTAPTPTTDGPVSQTRCLTNFELSPTTASEPQLPIALVLQRALVEGRDFLDRDLTEIFAGFPTPRSPIPDVPVMEEAMGEGEETPRSRKRKITAPAPKRTREQIQNSRRNQRIYKEIEKQLKALCAAFKQDPEEKPGPITPGMTVEQAMEYLESSEPAMGSETPESVMKDFLNWRKRFCIERRQFTSILRILLKIGKMKFEKMRKVPWDSLSDEEKLYYEKIKKYLSLSEPLKQETLKKIKEEAGLREAEETKAELNRLRRQKDIEKYLNFLNNIDSVNNLNTEKIYQNLMEYCEREEIQMPIFIKNVVVQNDDFDSAILRRPVEWKEMDPSMKMYFSRINNFFKLGSLDQKEFMISVIAEVERKAKREAEGPSIRSQL